MTGDDDLEAFTARIRAHRRKAKMAKLIGVSIGLFGIVPAGLLAWVFSFGSERFGARVFIIAWIATCGLGGLVWRKLEPEGHVDDIE